MDRFLWKSDNAALFHIYARFNNRQIQHCIRKLIVKLARNQHTDINPTQSQFISNESSERRPERETITWTRQRCIRAAQKTPQPIKKSTSHWQWNRLGFDGEMKGNARGRKRLAGVNFANVATRCHFSKSLPNGRPFISFIRASETALTLRLPVSSVSFYLGIGCCCVVSSLSPPPFFFVWKFVVGWFVGFFFCVFRGDVIRTE